MNRAIVVVLDGCGAGTAPDAAAFGNLDHPSTLLHVWERVGGFHAPTLAACGFLASGGIPAEPAGLPGFECHWGRLRELTVAGKDSVSGHWEMAGIVLNQPFPTYPNGFPDDLIHRFEAQIGSPVLGNKAASGTQIIAEMGAEHLRTHRPIVYTSADSVFQIACHSSVAPLARLYEMCFAARRICVGEHAVERVIARPFEGDVSNGFHRTAERKDFPLDPPPNVCDAIGDVFGIGVVPELFNGRGFRSIRRTQSNADHAMMLDEALDSDARFIFANFEDTDMLYGHRNDPIGFARTLEVFDLTLAWLVSKLHSDDILILTADHGNDPTTESTDHSREFVPCMVLRRAPKPSSRDVNALGDVSGMAAIGATVAAHLKVAWSIGTNLLP